MFHASLSGLTPDKLAEVIQDSPAGFFIERDAVYYLGKQIELSRGETLLAREDESEGSQGACRDLCKWLPSLPPETRQKLVSPEAGALHRAAVELQQALASSQGEAMQQAAADLITAHGREAITHATGRQLKIAVALRYIGTDYCRIDQLSNLKAFTPKEKYQILQTLQQNNATALHGFEHTVLEGIEPNERFNLFKESLQFPYPDAAGEGFSSPLCLSVFEDVANQQRILSKDIALMRKFIGKGSRDMADVLNSAIDKIPVGVQSVFNKDMVSDEKKDDYFHRTNHIFYLIAACCHFSDADDIKSPLSYLTKALALPKKTDLRWVARDLLFHLRNPDAVNDYSRYFRTVMDLLNRNCSLNHKYHLLTKLTDIVQIRLDNSSDGHASFLGALARFVLSHYPEHGPVLMSALNKPAQRKLASKKRKTGSIPEENQQTLDQQAFNQRVVRLLFLASACSSAQTPPVPGLAPFVQVTLNSEKNFFGLFNGWSCLVQSATETQRIMTQSVREDNYLLSALLSLPQLRKSQLITDSALEAACNNLLTNFAALTPSTALLKQWFATLGKLVSCQSQTGVNLEHVVNKLTGNMSHLESKLHFIDALMDTSRKNIRSPGIQSVLKLLGYSDCPDAVARAIDDVVSEFADNQNPVCQWLWAQRQPHILVVYLQKIVAACFYDDETPLDREVLKNELIELIHEFAQTSAAKTFITTRHCTTNNPHLAAIYQQRPDLAGGWSANFHGFSDAVHSHLSGGCTLELSEDPWDLFVSSHEVDECKSPMKGKAVNCRSIMSHTMDGSYAVIAKKNRQGVILRKSLIRLVLIKSKRSPALLVVEVTPRSARDQALIIIAASELARQMNLPLFKREEARRTKMLALEGRAPFDDFGDDSELIRTEGTVTGNVVTLL